MQSTLIMLENAMVLVYGGTPMRPSNQGRDASDSQRIFEMCFFSNKHVTWFCATSRLYAAAHSLYGYTQCVRTLPQFVNDVFPNYRTTIEFIDHTFELVEIIFCFKYFQKMI